MAKYMGSRVHLGRHLALMGSATREPEHEVESTHTLGLLVLTALDAAKVPPGHLSTHCLEP